MVLKFKKILIVEIHIINDHPKGLLDQFVHHRDHGLFMRFAFSTQALIQILASQVISFGALGGHI